MQQKQIVEAVSQALKFLALGTVNFVLTFAIFTGLLKIWGLNHLVSLFAAWAVGMIFMYVTNFVWVFRQDSALRFDGRFLRFVATGVISISGNMLALHLLVARYGFNAFPAQILLIPFVVAFNFLAAKFFSLRQRKA